jgi:hypothetical protein
MVMLTTYLDETGHSRNEHQKFVGIAGLMAKAEGWRRFEIQWKKTLKKFNVPYIHMRERATLFKGWPKSKLDTLSAILWEIIREAKAIPLGSIIPMDDFRALEPELRKYLIDPYYLAMQNCVSLATIPALPGAREFKHARVAMVFSDQVEFKNEAMRLYGAIEKEWNEPILGRGNVVPHLNVQKDRVDPPVFRDMRVLLPLQAADMVAYEIYKEYEREYYKLTRKPRYGYLQIERLCNEVFNVPVYMIMRHTKESLSNHIRTGRELNHLAAYWANKRPVKNATQKRGKEWKRPK